MDLHEDPSALSPLARDLHRALHSLIEELDAVDWYHQRAQATTDDELRAIIEHNRDEEKEHAAMTLEWIRRQDPQLDRQLRAHLFTDGPIAVD
jgi:ferritin-like protein